MPKVVISNDKGLVQKTGSDFSIGTDSGFGMHILSEEVTVGFPSHDNDVAVQLSKYIPAGAVIMDAAITCTQKGTSAGVPVALEVHSAAVAFDATSAGTEIAGADEAGNKSIPDADLNVGSDGAVGDVVTTGTLTPVDRAGDKSYFQIAAKADNSADTGTPKVLVTVRYYGQPAVSIS